LALAHGSGCKIDVYSARQPNHAPRADNLILVVALGAVSGTIAVERGYVGQRTAASAELGHLSCVTGLRSCQKV